MAEYQILLVGIDQYAGSISGLRGAVADVQALRSSLCKLQIPDRSMTLLLSPRPSPEGAGEPPPGEVPTAENIRSHLARLASEVEEGDRVVFFFAGHGSRKRRDGQWTGTLVACDGEKIEDSELGRLLDQIYAKSSDLTVILACCHAAEMTRGGTDEPPEVVRGLAEAEPDTTGSPNGAPLPPPPVGILRKGRSPGWTALVACQPGEFATEIRLPDGRYKGRLTLALCQALDSLSSLDFVDSLVNTPTWDDIWPTLRRAFDSQVPPLSSRFPQTPDILGPRENRVLGGKPGIRRTAVRFARQQQEPRKYVVEAGWLDGCELGDLLAVRAKNAGSDADEQSSPPLLRITEEGPWLSKAEAEAHHHAIPEAGTATLRPGRRLRIVCPGALPGWLKNELQSSAPANPAELIERPPGTGLGSGDVWLTCQDDGSALTLRLSEPRHDLGPSASGATPRLSLLWRQSVSAQPSPEERNGILAVLRHCRTRLRLLRIAQRSMTEGAVDAQSFTLSWCNDSRVAILNNTTVFDLRYQLILVCPSGRIIDIARSRTAEKTISHAAKISFTEIDQYLEYGGSPENVHYLIALANQRTSSDGMGWHSDETFREVYKKNQPDYGRGRSSESKGQKTLKPDDTVWYASIETILTTDTETKAWSRKALLLSIWQPDPKYKITSSAKYFDNDVQQLATAINLAGFQQSDIIVKASKDGNSLTKRQILEIIDKFCPKIRNSVFWFHFSGHGVRTNGSSELCLGRIENGGDPRQGRLTVDDLLQHLATKTGVRCLVTLDACHTNGFNGNQAADVICFKGAVSESLTREMGPLSFHLTKALHGSNRMVARLSRDDLLEIVQNSLPESAITQSGTQPVYPIIGKLSAAGNIEHPSLQLIDLSMATGEQLAAIISRIRREITPAFTQLPLGVQHAMNDLPNEEILPDQPRRRWLTIIENMYKILKVEDRGRTSLIDNIIRETLNNSRN